MRKEGISVIRAFLLDKKSLMSDPEKKEIQGKKKKNPGRYQKKVSKNKPLYKVVQNFFSHHDRSPLRWRVRRLLLLLLLHIWPWRTALSGGTARLEQLTFPAGEEGLKLGVHFVQGLRLRRNRHNRRTRRHGLVWVLDAIGKGGEVRQVGLQSAQASVRKPPSAME